VAPKETKITSFSTFFVSVLLFVLVFCGVLAAQMAHDHLTDDSSSKIAVIGENTGGMFYSARPIANLQDAAPKLKSFTFNWDGTIDTSSGLSLAVLERCGRVNTTTGHNITAVDLRAAFDAIVAGTGQTALINSWFGGAQRVNSLRQAFVNLRKATNGKVAILSASWAPIPKEEWAEYILHVTKFLGLGFDAQHIVGVTALGPPIVPLKGKALKEYLEQRYGESPTGAVHVDIFKYASQILEVGANILVPDPTFVQKFNLNQMIIKAGGGGGSQVSR